MVRTSLGAGFLAAMFRFCPLTVVFCPFYGVTPSRPSPSPTPSAPSASPCGSATFTDTPRPTRKAPKSRHTASNAWPKRSASPHNVQSRAKRRRQQSCSSGALMEKGDKTSCPTGANRPYCYHERSEKSLNVSFPVKLHTRSV